VIWKTRVDPPEQFGFCSNDASIDCGTDADCGASNTCTTKPFYHDFGFLNGPIPVEVPDGLGTKTILISGSKNGTLYALNEADGSIAWTNAVLPKPISPGFAGFGLFNGPLAVADGRVHAALYELIPDRVCDLDHSQGCNDDSDCTTGTCLPLPDHLQAFDATDGSVLWTDDIGFAWSGVGAANGVVYSGTNAAAEFYAYNAATGVRLATFPIPVQSTSVARVDGDTLYIGYGIGGTGGVRAYEIGAPPVPALSGWVGLFLAGLLAGSAALVLRRRAAGAFAPARGRPR
jgi:outer membrane protein assembly factor BamB